MQSISTVKYTYIRTLRLAEQLVTGGQQATAFVVPNVPTRQRLSVVHGGVHVSKQGQFPDDCEVFDTCSTPHVVQEFVLFQLRETNAGATSNAKY